MKRFMSCLSAMALVAFGAYGQDTPAPLPALVEDASIIAPADVAVPVPSPEITSPAAGVAAPEPAIAPMAPAAFDTSDKATAPDTSAPADSSAATETAAATTGAAVATDAEATTGAAGSTGGQAAASADGTDAAANAQAAKVEVLPLWEVIVFCVVVIGVIGLGIWKSGDSKESDEEKEKKGAADYFLAGRGLSWWLVGFSLLAANISTEQFVGMSGQAADWLGLAIAGYEWLAAIVLVIVAFTFLPMLLKRGVFTIPQFLEERYNGVARVTMAIANLLILVGVPTAAVIYAGSTVVSVYFGISVTAGCIIIAVCATVYVYIGGLKACAWTDLIWGSGLIAGGALVAYYALTALGNMDPATSHDMVDSATIAATELANGDIAGALQDTGASLSDGLARLWTLNAGDAYSSVNGVAGKLHMMRPAQDPVLPWTVYLLGLWIPNFFYWGLNQYIMQRTLASKSLEEGQLGVVFAAFLKLLIPFVVIIPGILAYNLFRDDLKDIADSRAQEIIKSATLAETAGQKVIYNVSPARLIRADVEADSIALLNKNAATVGASDEDKANLAAAAAALKAIPASDTVARAEAAQKVIDADAAITAAARNDAENYSVTTALVGYHYDSAFATLLKRLLPSTGWAWFVLAALFGAVVSSLASMFNSASTLFTMDIYGKAKEVCGSPASQQQLVTVGRWAVVGCALIATVLAPYLDNPAFGGIFTFIQEFQGFLSPGVLAVFIFGFFVPKCPRVFGWLGIALGAVVFGILKLIPIPEGNEMMSMLLGSFLNRMAISFLVICLVGLIMTLINSAIGGEAVVLEDKGIIEMKTSPRAKIFGALVVIATITLYVIFW